MQKQIFPEGKMAHGWSHARTVIALKGLQPVKDPHQSIGIEREGATERNSYHPIQYQLSH